MTAKKQPKSKAATTMNFDDIKKQFSSFVNVTQDKSGFTALREPESKQVIRYVVSTKKGLSLYERSGNSWKVAQRLTTPKQIETLIVAIKKEVEARKGWQVALTPRFVAQDGFTCSSKAEMLKHLQEGL